MASSSNPPSSKDESISHHEKITALSSQYSTPIKSSTPTPTPCPRRLRLLSAASTPSKSPASFLFRPLTPFKPAPISAAFAPPTPTPSPAGRSPDILFSGTSPLLITIPSSPSCPASTPGSGSQLLLSSNSHNADAALSFTSSTSQLEGNCDYEEDTLTQRYAFTPTRRNSTTANANATSPSPDIVVDIVSKMRTMTLRILDEKKPEPEPENENENDLADGIGYGLGFSHLRVEVPSPDLFSEPFSERLRRPGTPHYFKGSGYAVSCRKGKGKKKSMEDTHKVMTMTINVLQEQEHEHEHEHEFDAEDVQFFGVFDGHGGHAAAHFAAQNIGNNIVKALVLAMEDDDHIIISKSNLLNHKNLEQAVRAGYLRTDEEFVAQGVSSGTTCVTALIIAGKLVVSNAGDSRAVISRRGGEAQALTCDHKAEREDEQERIYKNGGLVVKSGGFLRVNGRLVVSRGIGDSEYKELITPEPDTTIIDITSGDFEFLILATDGLWDVLTSQEAVDIARPFCVGLESGGPLAASQKLLELAVSRRSNDDITAMIIQLQHHLI